MSLRKSSSSLSVTPSTVLFARRLRRQLFLLALLLAAAGVLRAQDDTAGDPTSTSGDIGGLVTTAGSYNPYSGNVKRSVTDVVVPGSNGTIPLAFTRIYNSRANFLFPPGNGGFADSNWRHSYQWEGLVSNNSNNVLVYRIAYPDGQVVNFRFNRPSIPANENFARGPAGVSDRLEVATRTVGSYSYPLHLHLANGSQVHFAGSTNLLAGAIEDPYGALTLLTYGTYNTDPTSQTPSYAVPVLSSVTEPGGRSLIFEYATKYNSQQNGAIFSQWTVISRVSCRDAQNNVLVSALYNYTVYPYVSNQTTNNTVYAALTGVSYSQADSVGGGAITTAHYTYTPATGAEAGGLGDVTGNGEPPLLATADDPHFAGAMSRIKYAYVPIETSGTWGGVQAEQNLTTGETVSSVAQNTSNSVLTATETRGDHADANNTPITRTFTYPQTAAAAGSTNAKPFQVTTATDFQGHPSYTSYYAQNDPHGWGYVAQTVDANGVATAYQTEPVTGKCTKTTITGSGANPPSMATRKSVWGSQDGTSTTAGTGTCLMPYYLYQTTDARGQNTIYYRNTNTGLVRQIDYPDGSHEYFDYQGFSVNNAAFYKVWHHWDQRGAQTLYGYDETDVNHGGSGHAGLLTSVTRIYTDTVGATRSEKTRFFYDALDRVNRVKDPQQVTNTFTYNARHQLTGVTHAADNTSVAYVYDDYGNRTTATDELGHTAVTYYDEYHRVTSAWVPVNAPQADGTQLPNRYVAYAYERRNNLNQLIGTAASHTGGNWSVTWKPTGRASQRIFSPNNWLTDQYDGMYVDGNQYPVVPAPSNGAVHTSATYDNVGHVLTSTDAQGFVTQSSYDYWNRPSTATDPLGHVTTRTYYASQESSADATNPINCAGLPKQVTVPGSDLVNFPSVTTQYGNYDAMGRSTAVESPYTPNQSASPYTITTGSGYNPGGDLTSQSDGAQAQGDHTTGYAYDGLGRKSSCGYPVDNTTEQWTYDASGNLSTFKNRRGEICTYLYDGRNRCYYSYWTNSAGYWTSYTYDAASHVKEVNNPIADILFDYDDSGALIQEREKPANQSDYKATQYTHDLDGNVDKIIYPNGNYPCFTYDAQERCTSMYSGQTGSTTTFSAYAYSGDRLVTRALFNGFYTAYDYQNNGRVWDVWHIDGTRNKNISRRCYGYAPNGQVSWFDREDDGGQSGSSLENGRGDAFFYWPDGSLGVAVRDVAKPSTASGAPADGWPGRFSATADSRYQGNVNYANGSAFTYLNNYGAYDGAGNRAGSLAQMGQATPAYAVDGANRYTTAGFAYNDANGNTTHTPEGWTFAYDAENHLKSAVNTTTNQSIAFDYDGLGRLIAQINNGVYTLFYYAGSQRIEERDSGNALVYLYFYDAPGSDQILFRQGGHDTPGNPWGRLWYQYDLLGNTTHLSAEVAGTGGQPAGQVIEQYLYDAYGTPTVYDAAGNVQADGSHFDNRYLFKGAGAYQWLSQVQLYYCRARFYTPQHGRWLQPDPIGQAGGLNIYAYCHNDPVNGIDPNGLWSISDLFHSFTQWLSSGFGTTNSGSSSSSSYSPNKYGAIDPQPGDAERIIVNGNSVDPDFRVKLGENWSQITPDAWAKRTGIALTLGGTADRFKIVEQGLGQVDVELGLMAAEAYLMTRSPEGALEPEGGPSEPEGPDSTGNGTCFPKGTLIATPDGQKPIETLQVGDRIYSYDFRANRVIEDKIERLNRNFTYYWATIETGNDTIRSTRSHPLWVENEHRWYKAVDLKVGMKLLSQSGSLSTIRNVTVENLEQPQDTYNFTVTNQHNYFAGNTSVLVHNGPDFVVAPNGTVFPLNKGMTGPLPTRASGFQFNGGTAQNGLSSRVDSVVFRDANWNQGARGSYYSGSQKIDPYSGRTVSPDNPMAHIPCD